MPFRLYMRPHARRRRRSLLLAHQVVWTAALVAASARWLLAAGCAAWWCREDEACTTASASTSATSASRSAARCSTAPRSSCYALGHFLVTGIEFLGIWALFDRFGSIQRLDAARGRPLLRLGQHRLRHRREPRRAASTSSPAWSSSGDFDRLLLRPRSTVLQVVGQELQLDAHRPARAGRSSCCSWAALGARRRAGPPRKVVLLLAAIVGGRVPVLGPVRPAGDVCFWTIESLEIVNTVTYGGVETAQYPLAIYRPWFRRFFTFVVPLATMNYFPAHAILGKPDALGSCVRL